MRLTIPVRMHFSGDRLGPTFYGELACVIECMAREGTYTGERGNIEDQATAVILCLPHYLDSFHGDTHGTEEVGFKLIVHFLLGCRFGIT
jgi:hypothetical protein